MAPSRSRFLIGWMSLSLIEPASPAFDCLAMGAPDRRSGVTFRCFASGFPRLRGFAPSARCARPEDFG